MKITLKLKCNPYKCQNYLSFRQDSLNEKVMEGKLHRIRNGRLGEWLAARDGDWKGLFDELYDVFGLPNIDIFFIGIKEDYKELIAAYQVYAEREKGKMVVTFHLNPDDLALSIPHIADLPSNPTDFSLLDIFAPEKKLEAISELLGFCRNISDIMNNFLTEIIEEWEALMVSEKKTLEKVCCLNAFYERNRDKIEKIKEPQFDEEKSMHILESCAEIVPEQASGLCLKYKQAEAEIEQAVNLFGMVFHELRQEVIADVYTVSVNGMFGGWVEARDAMIRYSRFTHTIQEKYQEKLKWQAKNLTNTSDCVLSEPEWNNLEMKAIQEKRCLGKTRKLMFGSVEQKMVEYIDLQDWSESFLTEFSKAEETIVSQWLKDNQSHLQTLVETLYESIQQQREVQMKILRKNLIKTLSTQWKELVELKPIDTSYLNCLRKNEGKYRKYQRIKEQLELNFPYLIT